MGYAPIALILTPPSPADSGTSLTVYEDDGDRFPIPPFTALIFPVQTAPIEGTNAERVTVTAIEQDTFTIIRADAPIAIAAELQIAALSVMTNYNEGEQITLSDVFPAMDTGVALTLIDPQGEVGRYTSALAEAVDVGGSAYSLEFTADGSGRWVYAFTSDQHVHPEADFYIRFSEVY